MVLGLGAKEQGDICAHLEQLVWRIKQQAQVCSLSQPLLFFGCAGMSDKLPIVIDNGTG
jgi:hypothetical protein